MKSKFMLQRSKQHTKSYHGNSTTMCEESIGSLAKLDEIESLRGGRYLISAQKPLEPPSHRATRRSPALSNQVCRALRSDTMPER